MKAAVKYLVPNIPTELAVVVGEIVIRFGELERAIITALARITSQKEVDFLKEVGNYKQGDPLGRLITKAEKVFGKQYEWFDVIALQNLTTRRNFLHDALMQDLDGTLVWQSNSPSRQHRAVDYTELLGLKADARRAIIQINDGSLKSKTH